MIEDKLATTIIVEGIRSPFEVNMFKENFDDFIILSIFANPAIRFKRLQQRNREDDSENYEDFLKRDQMELDFGIGTVISLSDKIIINEKDLESYEKEINEFFKRKHHPLNSFIFQFCFFNNIQTTIQMPCFFIF